MWNTRRHLAVATLAALQFACLLAAVAWFVYFMLTGFGEVLRHEALQSQSRVAKAVVKTLRAEVQNQSSFLLRNHPDRRVQELVNRWSDVGQGWITVLDRASGHPMHPHHAGLNRQLSKVPFGHLQFTSAGGRSARIVDSQGLGLVSTNQGRHLAAIEELPELGMVVVAHRPHGHIPQKIGGFMAPHWRIGIILAASAIAATTLFTSFVIRRYDAEMSQCNARLEAEVDKRTRSLVNTRNAVIFGLAKLAESRDTETGQHLERIRDYVVILAEAMRHTQPEIDDEFIQTLALAAPLHDIGKVGIPDSVLLKPGKLTPEEYRIMQQHCLIGGECLEAIRDRLGEDNFLDMACDIALAHHERWDGGGYPRGLREKDIPLAARLVALADVYDALTSNRVYKQDISHEDSRRIILAGSGTQFDPYVVQAFLVREKDMRRVAETRAGATYHDPESESVPGRQDAGIVDRPAESVRG